MTWGVDGCPGLLHFHSIIIPSVKWVILWKDREKWRRKWHFKFDSFAGSFSQKLTRIILTSNLQCNFATFKSLLILHHVCWRCDSYDMGFREIELKQLQIKKLWVIGRRAETEMIPLKLNHLEYSTVIHCIEGSFECGTQKEFLCEIYFKDEYITARITLRFERC